MRRGRIFTNLLVRPLVGYDHVAGAAGNKLVPDLATGGPRSRPTAGKTYTFHLKSGRPVRAAGRTARSPRRTSLYALERLANPKDGGQYAFYFSVIKGWDAYASGKATSISGISTPERRHDRLPPDRSRPATSSTAWRCLRPAPIPPEVGKCFDGKPGHYGRDLVSSGPYMIAGRPTA